MAVTPRSPSGTSNSVRLEAGWGGGRINNMAWLVRLREEGSFEPFEPAYLDRLICQAGFNPSDKLRWVVELVLYQAYRDAHVSAQERLLQAQGPSAPVHVHALILMRKLTAFGWLSMHREIGVEAGLGAAKKSWLAWAK